MYTYIHNKYTYIHIYIYSACICVYVYINRHVYMGNMADMDTNFSLPLDLFKSIFRTLINSPGG